MWSKTGGRCGCIAKSSVHAWDWGGPATQCAGPPQRGIGGGPGRLDRGAGQLRLDFAVVADRFLAGAVGVVVGNLGRRVVLGVRARGVASLDRGGEVIEVVDVGLAVTGGGVVGRVAVGVLV